MAQYYGSSLFLLVPAPEEGVSYDSVLRLYPQGRQKVQNLDSGVDLVTPQDVFLPVGGKAVMVNLQVKVVLLRTPPPVQSIEVGPIPWAFDLRVRSSIKNAPLIVMANFIGTIDQGYRGPLTAAVRNLGDEPFTLQAGRALFQVVDPFLSSPEYEVLAENDPRVERYFSANASKRGTGGFGSTGAAGSATRAGALAEADPCGERGFSADGAPAAADPYAERRSSAANAARAAYAACVEHYFSAAGVAARAAYAARGDKI